MSSSNSIVYPQLGCEVEGDTPQVSPVLRDSAEVSEAAEAWRALAKLLAGRPICRESTNGGRAYPKKGNRGLTDRLPAVPAAIPVFSAAGDTRVLVIDLDTSKADRATVLRDADAVTDLVRLAGGRMISDESPSGGIHVYIPLAVPVAFQDARDFALALAARTPTMDPLPMLNLTDGLIRPPGSRHRSGGFQRLRGTLAAAYGVAKQPNPAGVWVALKEALAVELQAVHADRTERDRIAAGSDDTEVGYVPRKGGPRELAADYLRIATTGLYDTARYPSPSHARQAVLASAAWAGMQLADVISRVQGGAWPGLASFYARYRYEAARRKAMVGDWRNAVAWVQKARANDTGVSPVRISPTSTPPTQRAARTILATQQQRSTAVEFQFIREWWSAMVLVELDRYSGRTGPGIRMVLRALGEAAMMTGSRYIEFGTRSLDVASGLDHTTVAKHLRQLRAEEDPLVYLVENDRGLLGDLYELRIPEEVVTRASRQSWRAGKIQALRPVFRDLGLPAAFVYEALEHSPDRLTSFELAGVTGMARSTVYEALETLAAFNLVEQRGGRWSIVATTSLVILAESLGCAAQISERLARHRLERQAYRRAMHVVVHLETAVPQELYDPLVSETESALDVLERILGARRLA